MAQKSEPKGYDLTAMMTNPNGSARVSRELDFRSGRVGTRTYDGLTETREGYAGVRGYLTL